MAIIRGASLPDLIIFVFAIISLILYIFVLFVLIKNRKISPLDSYFYHLSISLGFADVINGVWLYVSRVWTLWGWIDWSFLFKTEWMSFWGATFNFSYNYLAFCQYFGILSMAINRYYNIVHFTKEIWTPKTQRLAIAIQWLAPILIASPYYTQEFEVTAYNYSGISYAKLSPRSLKFYALYMLITIFLSASIAVFMAVLYMKIILAYRKIKKENNLDDRKKVEFKMALIGLSLFVLMALHLSPGITFVFMAVLKISTFDTILFKLVHDGFVLFTVSNPWLMLASSSDLRAAIAELFTSPNSIHPISTGALRTPASRATPAVRRSPRVQSAQKRY